jgi:hypothetical protein
MLKIVATKSLYKIAQVEQVVRAWSIFQCVTNLVKCQLKVDMIEELDVPCNVWTR